MAVELVANAQQNGPWFINYPNGGPSGVQCATIATAAEQAATTPWALLQAITATSIQVPNVPHLVPGSSPPQYTGLPPGSTAQQLYAGAAVPGFTPPFLTWEFYSTTVGPTVTVTLPSTINGKANPLASFSITAPPGGPVVFTATTATTPYTASGTVISVDTLSALAVLIGTDMGTVLSYIGATSGVLWRPPSH